jgi:amino-acid N-acetyltransferase
MIRKATLKDVSEIHRLVEHYANKKLMLPRTQADIVDQIRDFSVADDGSQIVGCSALHVYGSDLAEIRSLGVDERHTRQGWGAKLARHGIDEAVALGIRRVFALTYAAPFFEKLGFRGVDKREMPAKIWADCRYCEKYDDCDELCVAIDLEIHAPSRILTSSP